MKTPPTQGANYIKENKDVFHQGLGHTQREAQHLYLKHQRHPEEEDHEAVKHTPAILDVRVITLDGGGGGRQAEGNRERESEINAI